MAKVDWLPEKETIELSIVKTYFGNFAYKDFIVVCKIIDPEIERVFFEHSKDISILSAIYLEKPYIHLPLIHAGRENIYGNFVVNDTITNSIPINTFLEKANGRFKIKRIDLALGSKRVKTVIIE